MVTRERGTVLLDSVAKGIIEQLQQDGRRSYAAIGKAIGMSEAAVRQRVQRLVEAGVVQIVAVTDPLQLGFERQALIGIKATGDVNAVADALADIPAVDYVVITAGSFGSTAASPASRFSRVCPLRTRCVINSRTSMKQGQIFSPVANSFHSG